MFVDAHYSNIIKRSWVVDDSGCWIYNGRPNGGRYYRVYGNGKYEQAHRVMLAIKLGRDLLPYPEEMALHHCNNDLCINPNHLYVGDYNENNIGTQKQLGIDYFTCKNGHDVSDSGNVLVTSNKKGEYRTCMVCHNIRSNENSK